MVAKTVATGMSKVKGKGREEFVKATPMLPLGKQLAHTDKKVRDLAIANLVAFLSRGGDPGGEGGESSAGYLSLLESEMDKLWKGLFYCYWMSDKPLVQQALANDLAELLLLIKPKDEAERLTAALDFLEGFWRAIIREWQGIDRIRMDKFYLLIRRYTNATFRLLAREQWSSSSLSRVDSILTAERGPLSWREKSIPSSLATHLADVFPDELDKVLALPEVTSQAPCPSVDLLHPFIQLLAHTPTQTVHNRLISSIFQPLLDALKVASPTPDAGRPSKRSKKDLDDTPMYAHIVTESCLKDGRKASASELRAFLLKALFDAAAAPDALEVNRRKIYKLWREEGGDDD